MKKGYKKLQKEVLEKRLISSDYDVAKSCFDIKGPSDVATVASSHQISEDTAYEFITCLGDLLGQDKDFQKMTAKQLKKTR